jgi:F0F1-type ATP synthase assembly protein I
LVIVRAPQTDQQRMASAYQGAIEAVLAVVICALGGYWLDGRFGIAPWGIFGGMGIGFAAFMVRMWRLRALMNPAPKDSESENEPPESR